MSKLDLTNLKFVGIRPSYTSRYSAPLPPDPMFGLPWSHDLGGTSRHDTVKRRPKRKKFLRNTPVRLLDFVNFDPRSPTVGLQPPSQGGELEGLTI